MDIRASELAALKDDDWKASYQSFRRTLAHTVPAIIGIGAGAFFMSTLAWLVVVGGTLASAYIKHRGVIKRIKAKSGYAKTAENERIANAYRKAVKETCKRLKIRAPEITFYDDPQSNQLGSSYIGHVSFNLAPIKDFSRFAGDPKETEKMIRYIAAHEVVHGGNGDSINYYTREVSKNVVNGLLLADLFMVAAGRYDSLFNITTSQTP